MTTIAYRNGIMVSDTAVTLAGAIVGGTQKLFAANNHIIGAVGGRDAIVPLLKWAEAGMNETAFPVFPEDDDAGFYAIIVSRDAPEKICYYWTTKKGSVIVDPMDTEYFAVGSGKHFAMGAMAHGASALDAVRAAIRHDPYTVGPLNWIGCQHGILEIAA